MEGLLSWLKDPAIHRIVFAKNCGARISSEVLIQIAARHGKELEFVQADSSPRTVLQGKGYGEGDLISQVLGRSESIRAAGAFIKITGKLYAPAVADFFQGEAQGMFFVSRPEPSDSSNKIRNLLSPLYRRERGNQALAFLKRYGRLPWCLIAASPQGWIDTRFYRVTCGFYAQQLLRSHLRVQDALGYTLENAVFDDLEKQPVRMINQPPVIYGTSGTLGTTAGKYSTGITEEAREMANRLLS
jgi:hypothetical protein